jgi:GxxExxY protein
MTKINELCDAVREASFSIHCYLRNGHLEKVYENGLAHRLRKLGLLVEQQHPVDVHDEDGTLLGQFFVDLLIEGELIIELKAAKSIASEHVAQVLGYLRATGKEHALLINFGAPVLYVKKFILSKGQQTTDFSL